MSDFGFLLRLRNIFLTLHRKFKTMLSKNKIKFIHSLQLKKFRDESGFFIAEGSKLIHDLANSFDCKLLVYTGSKEEKGILSITAEERILTDEAGLRKVSAQKTPEGILAVFRKPESVIPSKEKLKNQLCLALDDIQNPGNLGTIIRIADGSVSVTSFAPSQQLTLTDPKLYKPRWVHWQESRYIMLTLPHYYLHGIQLTRVKTSPYMVLF